MPRIPSSIQCQRPPAPQRRLRKGLLQKATVLVIVVQNSSPLHALFFPFVSANFHQIWHHMIAGLLCFEASQQHDTRARHIRSHLSLGGGLDCPESKWKVCFSCPLSFTHHKPGEAVRKKKCGIWRAKYLRGSEHSERKCETFCQGVVMLPLTPVVHTSWINAAGRQRFITFEMTRHHSAGSSGCTVTCAIMLLLLSRLWYYCCCRKQWSPHDLTAFPDTIKQSVTKCDPLSSR